MLYENELCIAIDAVSCACKLCSNIQYALAAEDTLSKADKSPVTIADFGSQAVVNMILGKEFSDDDFVCEEDSAELRENSAKEIRRKVIQNVNDFFPNAGEKEILDAIDLGAGDCNFTGRYWTLDPIDGTKGFLRGDQYAAALALVVGGEVALGVLGCPNMYYESGDKGAIFFAVKNHGAYCLSLKSAKKKKIKVDQISAPAQAVFCESVESAHTSHGASAEIAKLLNVTSEPFRIDSQCKYAAVASGMASVYLRLPTKPGYVEKIWDHAAGKIVVEEAGGKVSDINGKPLDFSKGGKLTENSGVVATNGKLHSVFIDAINKVL